MAAAPRQPDPGGTRPCSLRRDRECADRHPGVIHPRSRNDL